MDTGFGYFIITHPEGTHLGFSRDGAGFSPNLFSDKTNKLVGQITLLPVLPDDGNTSVDVGDLDWRKSLIIGVAVVAIATTATVLVVANRNRIRAWWQGKVIPLLARSTRQENEQIVVSEATPEQFEETVDLALADYRANMSSAEAKQRLVALLVAAAFVAEQIRLLGTARIEDSGLSPELDHTMAKLSNVQVTQMIDQMLQSDPSLLDEATSVEFMRLFGGGVVTAGRYVPLREDGIREALRLTCDDTESLLDLDGKADTSEDDPLTG